MSSNTILDLPSTSCTPTPTPTPISIEQHDRICLDSIWTYYCTVPRETKVMINTLKVSFVDILLQLHSCRWGWFLGEQSHEGSGVIYRSTASKVLAHKSNHFVSSKMILCHEGDVAIVALPKLQLFGISWIYVNNLPFGCITKVILFLEIARDLDTRVWKDELVNSDIKTPNSLFCWCHMMHEQRQACSQTLQNAYGQPRQLAFGKEQWACLPHNTLKVPP